MCVFRPLLTLLVVLLALPAMAQDEQFATDDMKKELLEADKKEEEVQDGWKVTGKIGATGSLNHNDSVVGVEDGISVLIGGIVSAAADYRDGPHRWENTFSLQESFTRPQQPEVFIKSLDQLDLISTYFYRFGNPDWLGLFGRFSLNAQLLPGNYTVLNDSITTLRQRDRVTGATTDTALNVVAGDGIDLTNWFEPLTLRQSVGLFADPIKSIPLNLGLKLGLGAQEIITQGGNRFIELQDNDTVVLVEDLEGFVFELGIEVEVDARGDIIEKTLNYFVTLNAFYPPITTSDIERSFSDSINMRLKAGVGLKLSQAISVDYVLTVLRIPAVTTDLQVQGGLLISAAFDLL